RPQCSTSGSRTRLPKFTRRWLAPAKALFSPRLWVARRTLLGAARKNSKVLRRDSRAAEDFLRLLPLDRRSHPGLAFDREFAAAFFFGATLALDLNAAVMLAAGAWNRHRREFLWRTVAVTLSESL